MSNLLWPAVVGAVAGLLVSLFLSWWQDRRSRAFELANEYLSEEFIRHRQAVYGLSQAVADGKTTTEAVARGYWFPGLDDAYVGDQIAGLSQHQHLEIELGWYRRVGSAVKRRQVSVHSLRDQVGGSLDWSANLIHGVCEEVKRQAREAGGEPPEWVSSVTLAQNKLVANKWALKNSATELRRESKRQSSERGTV